MTATSYPWTQIIALARAGQTPNQIADALGLGLSQVRRGLIARGVLVPRKALGRQCGAPAPETVRVRCTTCGGTVVREIVGVVDAAPCPRCALPSAERRALAPTLEIPDAPAYSGARASGQRDRRTETRATVRRAGRVMAGRIGRDFERLEAECRAALDAALAARTVNSGRSKTPPVTVQKKAERIAAGRLTVREQKAAATRKAGDLTFACVGVGCGKNATVHYAGRGPIPDRCNKCVDPTTRFRRRRAAVKRKQRARQAAEAATRRLGQERAA